MQYALNIRKHNQQAHIDIEEDIKQKKDGLFTFILRVNNGNIVDYSLMEYIDSKKYRDAKEIEKPVFVLDGIFNVDEQVLALLTDNIILHTIVEGEVLESPYSQITFNVEIKNGVALIETINIVKNKRKKYDLNKET